MLLQTAPKHKKVSQSSLGHVEGKDYCLPLQQHLKELVAPA